MISEARLLDHVNVYKRGEDTKAFTIFCNPCNGERSGSLGRYSMIHYKHETNGNEYFGMVVGIFMYSVNKSHANAEYFLTAVVARVEIVGITGEKHVFPLPKYKFLKNRDRRFQLDQIQLKNVLKPLFFVSHGAKGFAVNDTSVSNDNRFIIISEDMLTCENVLDYDHYEGTSRLVSSYSGKKSVLDLKVFLNVIEMEKLKKDLFVEQKCVKKKKEVQPAVTSTDDEVHLSDLELGDDSSSEDEEEEFIE